MHFALVFFFGCLGGGAVISIRVSFSERPYFEYTRMPSPIYQHMINLVVLVPIRIGPGIFINILTQAHRALHNSDFFLCGKVYYFNIIVITNLMYTLIPDCRFENIFSPLFCIKIS
jgi:hypothetical protein